MEKIKPSKNIESRTELIEIELWQRKNKLLWRRMEGTNKERQKEIERKRLFRRVIDKIRIQKKQMKLDKEQADNKREKYNQTQKYRNSKKKKQCHPVQKT